MRENQEIDHNFPKKAILSQRFKTKKDPYEPLKQLSIKKTVSLVNYEFESKNEKKEERNPLVSFQVDQ